MEVDRAYVGLYVVLQRGVNVSEDQLSLGGEGALYFGPESSDHLPNPIYVPPGMAEDPDVNLKDIGAFVIMKSFGRRAEASLEAYAERGGCDLDTFRGYQKRLVRAGWITLLREGRPGKKGEFGQPRRWWLCTTKKEAPPLWAFDTEKTLPSTNRGISQSLGVLENQENPHPKQKLSKGSKLSSIKDNEAPKGASKKHPDEKIFWDNAKASWEKYMLTQATKVPFVWPAVANFQARLTKAIEAYSAVTLAQLWSNYLLSSWPTSKSLLNFLVDPAKYTRINRSFGAYDKPASMETPDDFQG